MSVSASESLSVETKDFGFVASGAIGIDSSDVVSLSGSDVSVSASDDVSVSAGDSVSVGVGSDIDVQSGGKLTGRVAESVECLVALAWSLAHRSASCLATT